MFAVSDIIVTFASSLSLATDARSKSRAKLVRAMPCKEEEGDARGGRAEGSTAQRVKPGRTHT